MTKDGRIHIFLLTACCLALFGALSVRAAEISAGQLIKGSRDTVYYLGVDGKRYLFPTRQTFESWYPNFADVRKVPDDELHSYPLGGNITYRPGVKMVKAVTSPHVYAVDAGGNLRWIRSEAVASEIYGADWKKKVDDLPDTFFANYVLGAAIEKADDFRPAEVKDRNEKISQGGKAAAKGTKGTGEETAPAAEGQPQTAAPENEPADAAPTSPRPSGGSQAAPATETGESPAAPETAAEPGSPTAPTEPTDTGTTTAPTTPTADETTQPPPATTDTGTTTTPTEETTPTTTDTSGTQPPPATTDTGTTTTPTEETTKNPPHSQTISGVAAIQITSHSATIVWQTETSATSFVDYGAAANAYTTSVGQEKPRVKDHSVTLNGLEPSTIYHYRARSNHGSDNDVMSPDAGFMTLAP